VKKLKEDFKKMLNGLAQQNAGDFLSRKEKMKILGDTSKMQKAGNVVELVPVVHADEVQSVKLPEQSAA